MAQQFVLLSPALNRREIADRLDVSEDTVHRYKSAFQKMTEAERIHVVAALALERDAEVVNGARQELAEKARAAKQGDGDYEPLDVDEEDSDSSERSDTAEDDTEQNLTKREQRIQRLKDGVEDGAAYTSNELAAIAYDKDVDDVTLSDRAYISDLRSSGDIDLQTVPDPHRGGNAKLYYRGEQPDVAVSDEPDDPEEPAWTVTRVETVMHGQGWMTTEEIAQSVLDKEDVSHYERGRFHSLLSRNPDLEARITSRPDPDEPRRNQYRLDDTGSDDSAESESACGCPTNAAGEVQHEGDCPHGVEQEIEEMQDLYQEDEPADPDLPEPDPEPDEPVPADTETGDDEDDEDSEDAFTCTACGQQFDTFHGLQDHHCETGDFPCPECDKAFDDDEALQNHLRDKHPGFYGDDPVIDAGTDEDADDGEDDEEELLEEMGPCNIGKIMVQGEFERYVCQECDRTFHEESAADAHADDASHPTFKAFDQVPDRGKQPAGFVGGGTAR